MGSSQKLRGHPNKRSQTISFLMDHFHAILIPPKDHNLPGSHQKTFAGREHIYWCCKTRLYDSIQFHRCRKVSASIEHQFLRPRPTQEPLFFYFAPFSNSPLIYSFSRLCPSRNSRSVAFARLLILFFVITKQQSGRVNLFAIKFVL